MNLRFATPTTPLPPDVRDRISRAVREQADHALRIRGSDPSAASSDSPLPSEPARSSIPVPTSDASLPTTKILSLGLGFIGAALIAIVITLFLRYYLVTRDRRQAADGIPPRDGQGEGRRGFWGSFAEWWAGYWTGSGTEFWGPQYVVRRRSKRPEMWEVMLDEKALGSPGQDSRLSADAGTAKEGEKAAQRADVAAEAGVAEGSGRTESICKVGRAAEEAEELFGGLTQPLAVFPTGPPPPPGAKTGKNAQTATGDEKLAISVLLLMPSQTPQSFPDDLPPLALGTAYVATESPLPELGHVRSRAMGEEDDDKDEYVLNIVPVLPRYPLTYVDLAMVRF